LKGFAKALIACCFFFIVLFAISSYIRFSTESFEATERIKTAVKEDAVITFDSTGSVLLQAKNVTDIAFSLGLVHAENSNWPLFLNQTIASGKLSKYFGSQWLNTDAIVTAFQVDKKAEKVFDGLSPENKNLLIAYVNGINSYYKRNQRSLDIRFAKHDLSPVNWQPYTPISLWLVELIIDNPAISQDALLVSLGMDLSQPQKRALFQALPRTNVFDSQTNSSIELLQQLLSLHKSWVDLSIKTGLKSLDVGNSSIANAGNGDFSGIVSSRSEPVGGFKHYLATKIEFSENTFYSMSQIGSPIHWLKGNPKTKQQLLIDRGEDGFHSLNVLNLDAESMSRIEEVAIVLDDGSTNPVLREFHFFDGKHLVFNYEGSKLSQGSSVLILSERLTTSELSKTYNELLNISYGQIKSPLAKVPMYDFIAVNQDEKVSVVTQKEWTNELPGILRSLSTTKPTGGNEAYSLSNPFTGFVISQGSMFVKNEQRFFKGWRNDPFSLEYLQTELLIDQKLSQEKVLNLISSDYSSFAAKTLIEIGPILAKNTSNEDIAVASAYFENWNYLFDENAAAATIFDFFYRKLIENIFNDEISSELFQQLQQQNTLFPVLTLFALNNNLSVFDNITTTEIETKEEVIIESLKQAMIAVKREFGNQTEDWRWENYLDRRTPIDNTEIPISSETYHDLLLLPANNTSPIFAEGHWSTPNRLAFIKAYETQHSQILKNTSQMVITNNGAFFKGMPNKFGNAKEANTLNSWKELNGKAPIRTINLVSEN
jgi:penicillin amidase